MDFLKMSDISQEQLREILALSSQLKTSLLRREATPVLANQTMVMLFSKNSTRTRVSFEIAMTQLGGHAVFLSLSDSQGARGETFRDIGASCGSMAHFVMARLHSHPDIEELAAGSQAPVINGLSDLEHPCQALADLLTLQECGKLWKGAKLAFIGDCRNNVANSLLMACAMAGLEVSFAGPKGRAPLPDYLAKASEFGCNASFSDEPLSAVAGADAVYTDTWVSMGHEAESESRMAEFSGYTVDSALMSHAKKDAIFMHCLPAHRGCEVSAGVIDGPQSAVVHQAENRLHAQKGLLCYLAGLKNRQSPDSQAAARNL